MPEQPLAGKPILIRPGADPPAPFDHLSELVAYELRMLGVLPTEVVGQRL